MKVCEQARKRERGGGGDENLRKRPRRESVDEIMQDETFFKNEQLTDK